MNVLSSHNKSHSFWENRTFACHASEVILAEDSIATSVTTGILNNSQIPGLLHHCCKFMADITQLQRGCSGAVLHHGWEPTADSVTISLTSGLPVGVVVVADIWF